MGSADHSAGRALTFGPYRLEGPEGLLWRRGRVVPLPPKATCVLWGLASHPGQLVTKQALLEIGWPDTAVGEAVLTVTIRTLRQVLDDDRSEPRYIETVHRRGYRFVAPVEASADEQAPTTSPAEPPALGSAPAVESWSLEPHACVGRDEELARLRVAFEAARRGQRQTVFVAGEPGIGKTALIDAFVAELRRSQPVMVGRGQCVEQYGAGEPYLPLHELLGGLGSGAGATQVLAGLRQHAPSWLAQLPALLPREERDALRHQIEGFTRPQMLRELADLADALAAACPLVWILEDLHWSDPSTVEALAIIARRRVHSPLLVVGSYRPVDLIMRQHPLKAAKEELRSHGQCVEIVLGPLSDAAVATYLARRSPEGTAPADVTALVQGRTQGHPLFMATLADYLVAQGMLTGPATADRLAAVAAEVPQEVQAFIEAQMGRLSPTERSLLEAASAVGMRFTSDCVAAAVGTATTEIETVCDLLAERRQFLDDIGVAQWPDGITSSEYQFRHALYHTALYRHLSSGRRARLHRAIGLYLERVWGGRASEIAAELALHFEWGGDGERAIGYRRQAASSALQRWAYPEALEHVTKALHLIGASVSGPEQRAQERELQILRGAALIATEAPASPDVTKAFDRARELCEPEGDVSELFPILRGLWVSRCARADFRAARSLGEEMLSLAQRKNDAALLVEGHRALCAPLFHLGELGASLAHAERAVALYRPREHRMLAWRHGQDPGVASLAYASFVLWYLGYADQALAKARRGVGLAREMAQAHAVAMAHYALAIVHQLRREPAAAIVEAETAVEISVDGGFPLYEAFGRQVNGWGLVVQGQAEEGIRQMEQGLRATETIGVKMYASHFLARLAEAHAFLGQIEEGRRFLDRAAQLMEATTEHVWEAEIHRLRGHLALLEAGIEGPIGASSKRRRVRAGSEVREAESLAESWFRRAINVARHQEARSLELRAATSLARLWHGQGQGAEARELLEPVHAWFTEGFDTADLSEARQLAKTLA